MVLNSFQPVFREDARVLILGSMPGNASLNADQYYAHPRNVLWPILADLFHEPLPDSYGDRLTLLLQNKCALWDVLRHCEREGSLDSNIKATTEVPNDFVWLCSQLPKLQMIVFNGKKAEQSFRRHQRELFRDLEADIRFVSLPSTSPANAAFSYDEKLRQWSQAFSSLEN
jgi:hypoxanthine-DNA glycosylase